MHHEATRKEPSATVQYVHGRRFHNDPPREEACPCHIVHRLGMCLSFQHTCRKQGCSAELSYNERDSTITRLDLLLGAVDVSDAWFNPKLSVEVLRGNGNSKRSFSSQMVVTCSAVAGPMHLESS